MNPSLPALFLLACAPFCSAAPPEDSQPDRNPVPAAVTPGMAVAPPPAAMRTPPPAPKSAVMPKADCERLPNGDVRIGQVTLHRKERQVSFPAKVVMVPSTAAQSERGGIIEVLVAGANGRQYEAVFGTEAVPSHVQVMLVLLGAANGGRVHHQQRPQGDLVDIDVEWKRADGTLVVEPIENFLEDKRTQKTMVRIGWVFTGTPVQDNKACADEEGNVVLSWSCGSTILDSPDMQAAQKNLFIVNPDHAVPGLNTPVRIILTPRARKAAAVAPPLPAAPPGTGHLSP